MRTECKNFESRSYPNGDTVRKCNLDLAPDAPWRCPENCPKYERRLADAAGSVSQGHSPVGHTAGDVCGDDVSAQYSFLVICSTDRKFVLYQSVITRLNAANKANCLISVSKLTSPTARLGRFAILAMPA